MPPRTQQHYVVLWVLVDLADFEKREEAASVRQTVSRAQPKARQRLQAECVLTILP